MYCPALDHSEYTLFHGSDRSNLTDRLSDNGSGDETGPKPARSARGQNVNSRDADTAEPVALQFGRLDKDKFALDVAFPLSPLQVSYIPEVYTFLVFLIVGSYRDSPFV